MRSRVLHHGEMSSPAIASPWVRVSHVVVSDGLVCVLRVLNH